MQNTGQQLDDLYSVLGYVFSPRVDVVPGYMVHEELPVEVPRLRMTMSCQPEVIICPEILESAAAHIKENADDLGYFKAEFDIEFQDTVILFDIDCRLFYDGGRCSGVRFYGEPEAHCYDIDGSEMRTDFTADELAYFIKG